MTDQPADSAALATSQGQDKLQNVITELQTYLQDSPLIRAGKERDHWMKMWDHVWQDVLKNMEQIRIDQTTIRRKLNDETEAGAKSMERLTAGTERIIAAIKASTQEIIAALKPPPPPPPPPRPLKVSRKAKPRKASRK